MNNRVYLFLIWLAVLLAVGGVWRYALSGIPIPYDPGFQPMLALSQLQFLYYALTPLIAVLIVERGAVRRMIREYRITLRGIDPRSTWLYGVGTFVLFPLLMCLCVYLFGDLGEMRGIGRIMFPSDWTFGYIMILWGLTVGLIGALPVEIAFRGFLEHNVTWPDYKKYRFIGVVWGVWSLFPVLFGPGGFRLSADAVADMAGIVLMCIACSFYYASALHRSRSLFVPALLQGVIRSSPVYSLMAYGDHLWTGSHGLFAAFVVLILYGLMPRLFRNTVTC